MSTFKIVAHPAIPQVSTQVEAKSEAEALRKARKAIREGLPVWVHESSPVALSWSHFDEYGENDPHVVAALS